MRERRREREREREREGRGPIGAEKEKVCVGMSLVRGKRGGEWVY